MIIRTGTHTRFAALIPCGLALATLQFAHSAEVTVQFEGTVVSANPGALIAEGDRFSGRFSYDPDGFFLPANPVPIGDGGSQFEYTPPLRSFHLEANGAVLQSFTFEVGSGFSSTDYSSQAINVGDYNTVNDRFFATYLYKNNQQVVIDFIALSPDLLSSSSLPRLFPTGWSFGGANPSATDAVDTSYIQAWDGNPQDATSRFVGILTTTRTEFAITSIGFDPPSGDLLLHWIPGGTGFKVTSSSSLSGTFTEVVGASLEGNDSVYRIPAASLNPGRDFFRIEQDP